jgi:hypothetical protein
VFPCYALRYDTLHDFFVYFLLAFDAILDIFVCIVLLLLDALHDICVYLLLVLFVLLVALSILLYTVNDSSQV